MAEINVVAERTIPAPPEQVYQYIADYARHRPHWLTPAFSNYRVVEGGTGAGTVFEYRLHAGNRERAYRMQVAEPILGRELTESDTGSSLVTTWSVTPQGAGSSVRLQTTWQGAGGVGGFFERTFAPRALRGVYGEQLAMLDRYAQEEHGE